MKRFSLPLVLSIVFFASLLVVPLPARAAEPINFKRASWRMKNPPYDVNFVFDKKKIKRDRSLSKQVYERYIQFVENGIRNDSFFVVRNNSNADETSHIEFIFIDKDSDIELKYDKQTNYYYFDFVRTARMSFGIYKCGDNLTLSLCLSDYSDVSTYKFQLSAQYYSIVGLYTKKRVIFPEDYHGDNFSGGTVPVGDSVQRCQFHDIGCWIGNIFDGFKNTVEGLFHGIVSVFKRLLEFLSHIFIPGDDNIFKKAYEDLSVTLTKKLGFLLFPFEFFSKTLGTFSGFIKADDMSEWHCTFNLNNKFCEGVCVSNLIAQNSVCLRIGALEESAPLIWNTVMPVARVGFVLSLVYLLKQKFNEVVEA